MEQLTKWLTPYHFNELLKQGLSLDHVYLLRCIDIGLDMNQFADKGKNKKAMALLMTLERKFLITEEGKVSGDGRRLFQFLDSTVPEEAQLQFTEASDDFETWWKTYPSTDAVIIDGIVKFKPGRSLKGKKEESREQYRKVLAEGYLPEQLLKALAYEVRMKIEKSLEFKENKLRYMQNSTTYLRQRTFAQFIEVAELAEKQPATPVHTGGGTVDI